MYGLDYESTYSTGALALIARSDNDSPKERESPSNEIAGQLNERVDPRWSKSHSYSGLELLAGKNLFIKWY